MHRLIVGRDEDELRVARRRSSAIDLGDARANGLTGTPDELVARLREYESAGIERVMLQHLLHRDIEALELVAAEVLPAFA